MARVSRTREEPVKPRFVKVGKYEAEKHPDDKGVMKPGPGRESFQMTAFWKEQVNAYEQYTSKWIARGNNVIKRFRDERSKMETEGLRRMNILWANTNIMKPAIYSRCPDPIVDRKFLDKDPIGRLSSIILERTIRSQLEHGFHNAMNRAVYDRLLPGRGVLWVRYEPEYGENEEAISIPSQASNSLEDSLVKIAKDTGDSKMMQDLEGAPEDELEDTGDVLAAEKIVTDYIDWRDFYTFPARARTWDEVQAIGKRVYMSKQEARERFGDDIANDMHPDTQPTTSNNVRNQVTDSTIFRDINDRSIVVYEIWNKSDRKVYWISTGYEYLCDVREDPYKLKRFFPVAMPLSSTTTNDTLTPVPDYYEWQDQAVQIDELSQRIAMLTKACKVAGAYNAANKALARIFEETQENNLIPVDQWAMFAQNGGVKGAIDLVPLDQIQACIETLQGVRQQCMQDLDQVTDSTIFRDINDRSIVVYEIWNKSDRKVYWVSTGYEYLCDVREDPYKLKRFFPCPMPLSATLTNDTLNPVPDYYEWQDQAVQIDELSQRIAMLTKACKVAGAYNAANKALARIFEETQENNLIPVDQWAMFAQNGGVKGAIDLVPLDQIQACIETLQGVRQQCMQDLDQVTGISDVVRGTTDSRETLGGIRLKNNNAGTRLSESQTEVQRFARDIIELIGELAAKHFSDETLVECSGILFDEEMQPDAVMREFEPVSQGFNRPTNPAATGQAPGGVGSGPSPTAVPPVAVAGQPNQPQQGGGNVVPFPGQTQMPDPQLIIMDKLQQAIGLLRQDVPRNYRIAIETDSTIFGDKVQERQDASDFVEAMGGFMANFERLGESVPEAMPLLARTLEWAARKYRIGRDLEAEINSFVARMEKKAKLLIENPQPTIEQQKLQAQKEKDERDAQTKMQLAQMEGQRQEQDDMRQFSLQQQNDERDAQRQAAEDQRNAQIEALKFEIENEKANLERQKMAMELEIAKAEHAMAMEKLHAGIQADHMKMGIEREKAGMQMHQQQQEHAMNIAERQDEHAMQRENHEMQRQQSHEQHKQGMQANKQKADMAKQSFQQKQLQMKQKPKDKGKK